MHTFKYSFLTKNKKLTICKKSKIKKFNQNKQQLHLEVTTINFIATLTNRQSHWIIYLIQSTQHYTDYELYKSWSNRLRVMMINWPLVNLIIVAYFSLPLLLFTRLDIYCYDYKFMALFIANFTQISPKVHWSLHCPLYYALKYFHFCLQYYAKWTAHPLHFIIITTGFSNCIN